MLQTFYGDLRDMSLGMFLNMLLACCSHTTDLFLGCGRYVRVLGALNYRAVDYFASWSDEFITNL